MVRMIWHQNRLTVNYAPRSVRRAIIHLSSVILLGTVCLHSQCPDTGQTKVIKPSEGTGYYFYRFLGDSSFRYFLDGKTFRYDDKSDPGRTFVFIDDFGYESIMVEKADWEKYVKGSNASDILRAQAKEEQDYYKGTDPSMVITDYGPASRKNPDGSEDRLFYLWKKENPSGKDAARQFLVSTLVKDRVVLLSVMVLKASTSEDDVFVEIQKYTSHFDMLSSDQCARVLSTPSAHR